MCELVPLLQGEVTWARGRAVLRCCRRIINASWHKVEGLEGLPPPPKRLSGERGGREEVIYKNTHFVGWVWGVHAGTAAEQCWRMGFCIESPGDEHPSNNRMVQQVYT